MATLHCVTASNMAEVSDEEAVKELLKEYLGIPEKTRVQEGKIHIIGYESFHPQRDGEPDCTVEFLDRVRQHLKDELVIQTVGNEKCRYPLVACQYRVTSDGVYYSDLETDEREIGSEVDRQ